MNMPGGTAPVPGPFSRAIAAEVRQAMARHMVSGAELARMTGRSQSYFSTRLRADSSFTTHDVESICTVLGEDIGALLIAAVRASRRP